MPIDEHAFKRLIRGETRGATAALARFALSALAIPYGLGARFRNLAFDHGWKRIQHVPVPVVSVGNLTVGGAGKTPTVEAICNWLRKAGLRVAILSRGYGAHDGPNDEALVLHNNLPDVPHLQDPDRVTIAQIAVNELASEVIVLDDGFQHRRLGRDLDVVLIDATDPFGGGRLLPRGLLREPITSLRRAGIIVLTRRDLIDEQSRAAIRSQVHHVAPGVPFVEAAIRPISLVTSEGSNHSISELEGTRAVAFCGIGNPEGFWRTLESLGVQVLYRQVFPDHHNYTRDDVQSLSRLARQSGADRVLTTQKDLVKLRVPDLGLKPLQAVRVAMVVETGIEHWDAALERIVKLARSS
jgi:tetraacyldisaccharide 4'-kinase